MILETGKNLSVLIVTEADMNWQTFATWYSFFKNLPDAKIGIFCHRSESAPFMYFQWAKRLGIKRINAWPFSEEGPELLNWLECVRSSEAQELVTQPVLVIKPYVMALSLLDKKTLNRFNSEGIWVNQNACFINKKNVKELLIGFLSNYSKMYHKRIYLIDISKLIASSQMLVSISLMQKDLVLQLLKQCNVVVRLLL